MKSVVFDSGPIISFDLNNLLWVLEPLKRKFNGKFYITDPVKKELVDRPLEIKKYKFEAIQVEKMIEDNVIEIVNEDFISQDAQKLLSLANQIFMAHGNCIRIVHYAEMSAVAAGISLSSEAVVIDEKTARMIVENPLLLADMLKNTLHTPIRINEKNLKEFRGITKGVKIIRSVELSAVAYELGLLDKYVTRIPQARKNLLESILWGLKLSGCAVSRGEIEDLLRIEMK